MSTAIEILLRLRAENAAKDLDRVAKAAAAADRAIAGVDKEAVKAERALKSTGDAARDAERGFKATERGMNKLSSAIGGSQFVNDLDDVAEGIDRIGVGGAATVVGLGLMSAAVGKLAVEIVAIMRDVDTLAPRFEELAQTEIITKESIDASHEFTNGLDRLYERAQALVGVFVDFWAPAMNTVIGGLDDAAGAALRLYSIFEKMMKAGFAADLEGIGAALFGDKADSRAAWEKQNAEAKDRLANPSYTESAPGGDTSSLLAGNKKIQDAAAKSTPKAKAASGTVTPKSAAEKYAITGPSSAGMAQMDLSDVGADIVETASQSVRFAGLRAGESVVIDMSDVAEDIVGNAINELHTAAGDAAKKASRTATMGEIAGGLGTAQSALSGTAGIASAVSSTGPAGAVVGAVMSLGDTLAQMGTDGLQEMIDGVLSMPVTVLEMLPEILTKTIPNILSEGIPDLVSGIILALPDIVLALAGLVPVLIQSMVDMFKNLMKDLIVGLASIINPFDSKKGGGADGIDGKRVMAAAWSLGISEIFRGRKNRRQASGDDYASNAAPVGRQNAGSTARTSGPSGEGGGEQHVHVHIGSHIGTDAEGARKLAKLLKSHMGTRGTGLALG